MQRLIERLAAFLSEMKRRKVYRVVVLYCVGAYAVIELSDIVLPVIGAPESGLALVLAIVVAGLPIAVLLGWMYDLTQSGLLRDSADRSVIRARTRAGRAARVFVVLTASGLLGWASWTLANDPSAPEAAATPELDVPGHDPRRIAVLYFDDHSEGQKLGYLAAGLTESLIHELTGVSGLEVMSRSAVKPFRERATATDSIVAALGVGSLVEGSVTQAGNTIRATVQLIDGRTGAHLDSRVVEGSADSIFAFHDALADSLGRALRRHLGREIRLRGARAGTESQTAWTLYQRGNDLLFTGRRTEDRLGRQGRLEAVLRADSLLVQARAVDSEWVSPALARVNVATRLASLEGPRPGALDTVWAREAIHRADRILDEHPDEAGALESRAWTRLRLAGTPGVGSYQQLLDSAQTDLERAIRVDPDRAGAWWLLSEVLINKGQFAEAVEAADRALEADVFLDVEESAVHTLFYSTLQLGPVDEAIRWCDEGHERFPENANFVRCKLLILGTFPQVEPDVDRAWALLDELLAVASIRSREAFRLFGGAHVAQVLARAGLADSARAVLRAIRGPEPPPHLASHEAKVQLLLGNEDEALRLLRLYLTVDADTAYLGRDWWFDELHDHPGFRELVGTGDLPGE